MKSYWLDVLVIVILTGCVVEVTKVLGVNMLPVCVSIAGGLLGLWILRRLEGGVVYPKWITYPAIFGGKNKRCQAPNLGKAGRTGKLPCCNCQPTSQSWPMQPGVTSRHQRQPTKE